MPVGVSGCPNRAVSADMVNVRSPRSSASRAVKRDFPAPLAPMMTSWRVEAGMRSGSPSRLGGSVIMAASVVWASVFISADPPPDGLFWVNADQ
nr:hypothetical protein [Paramuribaculum intestinale]